MLEWSVVEKDIMVKNTENKSKSYFSSSEAAACSSIKLREAALGFGLSLQNIPLESRSCSNNMKLADIWITK